MSPEICRLKPSEGSLSYLGRNGVKYWEMRAVSAQLFALFAALVLLLPGTASARAQYYCRMVGHVIGDAACDNGAPSKASRNTQELQASDCCQRLSSSHHSAALGTLDAVTGVAPAAYVATRPQAVALGARSGPISFCAESTQAPLAIGPPLFIVNCALLS
jgi:hypothetical protein